MKYIDGRSSDQFWQAFRTQRKNAKKRGIEFNMAFDEWKTVWLDSGKWVLRGRNLGQYVMSRFGDIGAYTLGNVFIGTNTDNTREALLRRVYTDELRKKLSSANRGVPHLKARGVKRGPLSDEVKAKLRAANSGKKNPNATMSVWTPMKTPLGIFKNGAEAAKASGVTTRTAHNRCKSSNFSDWSYA